MKEFNIKNVNGFELVKEFSKRVVADYYDSFVDENFTLDKEDRIEVIPDNTKYFEQWLEQEANTLYEEIMAVVNSYVEFDNITEPEL